MTGPATHISQTRPARVVRVATRRPVARVREVRYHREPAVAGAAVRHDQLQEAPVLDDEEIPDRLVLARELVSRDEAPREVVVGYSRSSDGTE